MPYENEFDDEGFLKDRSSVNPEFEAVYEQIRQAVSKVVESRVKSDQQVQTVMERVDQIIRKLASHVYIQADWITEH